MSYLRLFSHFSASTSPTDRNHPNEGGDKCCIKARTLNFRPEDKYSKITVFLFVWVIAWVWLISFFKKKRKRKKKGRENLNVLSTFLVDWAPH